MGSRKHFKIFSPAENLKLQRNLALLCSVTCRLTVNQFMDVSNDALFINNCNNMFIISQAFDYK